MKGTIQHNTIQYTELPLNIYCANRYGVRISLSVFQNTVVRTPNHVTVNLFYIITKFGHTCNVNKASPLFKPGVSKSFFLETGREVNILGFASQDGVVKSKTFVIAKDQKTRSAQIITTFRTVTEFIISVTLPEVSF